MLFATAANDVADFLDAIATNASSTMKNNIASSGGPAPSGEQPRQIELVVGDGQASTKAASPTGSYAASGSSSPRRPPPRRRRVVAKRNTIPLAVRSSPSVVHSTPSHPLKTPESRDGPTSSEQQPPLPTQKSTAAQAPSSPASSGKPEQPSTAQPTNENSSSRKARRRRFLPRPATRRRNLLVSPIAPSTDRRGLFTNELRDWECTSRPDLKLKSLRKIGSLGEGQYGKVMAVIRHEDKYKRCPETFALKVMKKNAFRSERMLKMLDNEKRIMQSIQSDFAINLINTYTTRSSYIIMLEYAGQGDLLSHVGPKGLWVYEPGLIEFYIANVILGLKHLHENNIVHRDIKPGNILLGSDGYLKICDFGFAKELPHDQRTRSVVGTFSFLTPEQCRKESYGHWCDLWALGVTAYGLMYGRSPFDGSGATTLEQFKVITRIRILEEEVEFPTKRKEYSMHLRNLVGGLLCKSQRRRLGCRVFNDAAGGELSVDYDSIMDHRCFAFIDWEAIETKAAPPPWMPGRDGYGSASGASLGSNMRGSPI